MSEREFKLSREEQETIIRGNAEAQTWEVVTADPKIIRLMERQGYQPDDRKNPWGYCSFTVAFDRITIRKSEKRKPTGRPFAKRSENVPEHANSRAQTDQNQKDIPG